MLSLLRYVTFNCAAILIMIHVVWLAPFTTHVPVVGAGAGPGVGAGVGAGGVGATVDVVVAGVVVVFSVVVVASVVVGGVVVGGVVVGGAGVGVGAGVVSFFSGSGGYSGLSITVPPTAPVFSAESPEILYKLFINYI